MTPFGPDELLAIMPRCPPAKVQLYAACLASAMVEAGITTQLRTAAFLANLALESGELRWWEEDLNYSAEAIAKMWPKRFPTVADALPFAHAPEKLANRVYSGRMGNGDEASGDGWRYRGRGPCQITGLDNYRAAGQKLGVELVGLPDLALEPGIGFRVAGWFWTSKGLAVPADVADFPGVVKLWNGGLTDIAQRTAYYERAKLVLQAA